MYLPDFVIDAACVGLEDSIKGHVPVGFIVIDKSEYIVDVSQIVYALRAYQGMFRLDSVIDEACVIKGHVPVGFIVTDKSEYIVNSSQIMYAANLQLLRGSFLHFTFSICNSYMVHSYTSFGHYSVES